MGYYQVLLSRWSLLAVLLCLNDSLLSQSVLQGRIQWNSRWSRTLYISELTGLGHTAISDSITIDSGGRFTHVFSKGQLHAGLVRLILPPSGSGAYTFLDGPEENTIYLVVPVLGEVYLEADADQFFYSHKICSGPFQADIMALRDFKIPFLHFLEQFKDTIAFARQTGKPLTPSLTGLWLEELSQYRNRLAQFLQKDISDTVRLLGLCYYYQSLLGRYDWNFFRMIMGEVHTRELPLMLFLESEYQRHYGLKDTSSLAAFNIEDSSGQVLRFGELRADYLVLHFWASWCGPCRRANRTSLPALNALCRKSGFVFVGISADAQFNSWKNALKADRPHGLQFRDKGNAGGLIDRLGISSFPTYVVLDKNRDIVLESGSDAEITAFILQQGRGQYR